MDSKITVALLLLCIAMLVDQGQGRHRSRVPSSGLRMPARRKLITWNTFVNKVVGRPWNQLYLWAQSDFLVGFSRWTPSPTLDGQYVVNYPDHVRYLGECATAANFTSYTTTFIHEPGERMAISYAGTQEERFFTRDPDSYIVMVRCFSRVVKGVCGELGVVGLLVRNYPPNQLDWWTITCDLKNVMGFTLNDPRFEFNGVGPGCPEL